MTNLTESPSWEPGVYQIELTDPVVGGSDGISNRQAKQLANRTGWLKAQLEQLGLDKQPLDATLSALAGLAAAANQIIYATGPDQFAMAPLSAFIRSNLLPAADQASARAALAAAPLATPAFTGTPTAPTAAAGNNTTQLATTAFVQAAIAALVASSPGALDTLNELAAALGNDPSFATTMTNALAGKAPLASPTFSGTPAAPTAASTTSTTQIATTAFVQAVIRLFGLGGATPPNIGDLDNTEMVSGFYRFQQGIDTGTVPPPFTTANWNGTVLVIRYGGGIVRQIAMTVSGSAIADSPAIFVRHINASKLGDWYSLAFGESPTFTGTPAAPTAPVGTNTAQLATTAFVQAAIAALVDSSPAALNTLKELATALGNDANFATTMTNALAAKAPLASPVFTGTPAVPTQVLSDSTTQVVNSSWVRQVMALFGVGGARAYANTLNLDDAAIGSMCTVNGTESEAAALNWPVTSVAGATAVHYNVITFGQAGRITQIASQAYSVGGNQARTFVRAKHDAAWSGWDELFTSRNFNPALKANLASPALTGTPTAPTPALNDKSTKIATTDFVRKNGRNHGSVTSFNVSTTLTTAHANAMVYFYGSTAGQTITCLASASADVGTEITLMNLGVNVTVARSGADTFNTNGMTYTSFTLRQGESVTLICVAAGQWFVMGTGVLGMGGNFGASLGEVGWQQLPSGLIVQWGLTAPATSGDLTQSLPIAFPNYFRRVLVTQGYTPGTGSVGYAGADRSGLGAFIWRGSAVGNSYQYWAVGN
nr:hypothetical protein [Pseudomonas sp. BN415]